MAGVATAALVAGTIVAVPTAASAAPPSDVVINEVYGGGGNSGATYKQDFIELVNKGTTAIDLSTWSVQYASASGSTWQVTKLSGSIAPSQTFLVAQATGAGGTTDLPTPNVTGTIAMSGSAGKVALVRSQSALTCGATCNSATSVADFVGWGGANDFEGAGAAPGTTNAQSVTRNATHADTGNNAADFTTAAPTPSAGPGTPTDPEPEPDPTVKTINEIQGTGTISPFNGTSVTTKGVVTAAYPVGGLNGYTIQMPGTGGAIDFASHKASDAIFVFSAATVGQVAVGDYVQVTGTVGEYAGATQLNVAAGGMTKLVETVQAPKPATTTSFPTSDEQRESLESMLYSVTAPFTVTNTYATNQYGEVGLALGDQPLVQPTEVGRPGSAEAAAQKAKNAQNAWILDDGSSVNFLASGNSSLTPPYLSLSNPVRVGAAATFTEPVIFTSGGSNTNSTWRFQPTSQVTTAAGNSPAKFENTRTNAPNAAKIGDADFTVASFNVLNYFTFTGDKRTDCSSYKDRAGNPITVNTCSGANGPRGAWNAENLKRQQDKIVAAIDASGADVAGLMEVENSAVVAGVKDQALSTLVDALNAKAGAGTWAFVPSSAELPPTGQQDVITNAIIYKPGAVTPVGESRALGNKSGAGQPFVNAREPIGQVFSPKNGGEKFFVVVNHFKSKGSAGPLPGDADSGDGQGASNASRVAQATALKDWVPTVLDADTTSVVLLGDFNSYSQEDPMQVFYNAGYTNAKNDFSVGKYSYSFSGQSGSLDHVLLNADAKARATGADIWNINSPESVALQYSRYNYHGTLFYAADPFAASDHDPIVVGMKNGAAAATEAKLTLLNINDFHGRIDANTTKFATTVEQLRAAGGEQNTVLLSAGDNVGASLFASAFEDDKPTIDVLNALELKASAVGNHEFDKGFDDLKNRIMKPESATNPHGGADWKYLGANVYLKGTQTPALPEYEILTIAGLKVAVIGAVTQETPTLVSPAGVADLDFGDPVDAVNRVAAQLTDGDPANGEADVLIAEYHEGAGAGTPDNSTLAQEVAAGGMFAKIVNGTSAKVAAIFTGHTHKEYAWDAPVPGIEGKTRPILQTGSYGANVGEITLTVDLATKNVTAYTARNVKQAAAADLSLPRVATVKTIVDAALARAAAVGNTPIGKVTADITTAYTGTDAGYTGPGDTYVGSTRDDRSKESTLGDLVADSLVSSLSSADRGGATIGVVNPGGLRADLRYGADGTITYAQANAVLPFVNNLWTVTLTGAQFKTLLEQQWQTNADGTIPSRPYLQLGLSKNVTYTYDANAALGSHVTSVTIDGKPLDPAANYRIGTFSFLATGGDNFRIFTSGTNVKDSGLVDRDAWIDYLKANSPVSPDFARQAVSLPTVPTTVTPGANLAFTVGGLNLTSLGSPRNTEVTVKIGDTVIGTAPVTTVLDPADAIKQGVLNGKADVSLTVPANLPAGATTMTITAAPSGTTVTVPVTVKSAGVPPKVTATARSQCWAGQPVVAVYATNTGTVKTDIRLTTQYGDKKFTGVAPGTPVYASFVAGPAGSAIPAGKATIAAYTFVDGVGSYLRFEVPYLAIDCAPVKSTVTLTASATEQTFGTAAPAKLTAKVAMADGSAAAGKVVFRDGDSVLGTSAVIDGVATLTLPADLGAGPKSLTAEFVPTDSLVQAGSTSAPVRFSVRMALSSTTVTAQVVATSKAVEKATKLKSALVITASVELAAPSAAAPTGVVNVNVNGVKVASVEVVDGVATTDPIPVAKGTASVIVTFLPTEPDNVQRSTARTTVSVKK